MLIRLVLTALASLPLALVVCMVMFTVVVEGDSPAGPGANIGGGRRR